MPSRDTAISHSLEPVRAAFAKLEVSAELKDRALQGLARWLSEPQFEDAQPQLRAALESQNPKRLTALFDAFFQTIPFGTGGRRGPVGFGTNRINPHTIATSIQGHCEFLKARWDPPNGASKEAARELSVVVAYDVRVFQDLRGAYDPKLPNPLLGMTSRDFAVTAAQVYAANGIRVWFPAPRGRSYVSTPELSFAIRQLRAAGGVNISASHNHPDDNGAKVYNLQGAQEIPPLDEEMSRLVESIEAAKSMPWETALAEGWIREIPSSVHEAYVDANRRASRFPSRRSARVVFTPLHGTGWSSVGAALEAAGFRVTQVPSQSEPDGTFPNVPFRSPNPEVPQSLDAAIALAKQQRADLVLAADPDADRLGMAAPDPEHGWRFLTGNQIGVLLAAFILSCRDDLKRRKRPFALTTVVTTSLFSRVARSHGVQVVADLPIGFKYIADALRCIEETGSYRGRISGSLDDFLVGIEESHGYLVLPAIRDKDAAGAAVLLAELASQLKDEGRSVFDYLDDLYRRLGYVSNFLVSTILEGAEGLIGMGKIQTSLRRSPPDRVGGLVVERFTDRWDESGDLGPIVSETDRKARDLLTFELAQGARIILRPSGTEPKNKIYVETCGEPLGVDAGAEELQEQKRTVDAAARALGRAFSSEMLSRIGVTLPDYALEISDLVTLEDKKRFVDSFLPSLLRRVDAGGGGDAVEQWVDEEWRRYGKDCRLLFQPAVAAYLKSEAVRPETAGALRRIFTLP
jgi:phosphoglucomutase/phosphomannomutase